MSVRRAQLPLPPESPLAGATRERDPRVSAPPTCGTRPRRLADQPRITVRPDVIEELGGVSNLLFPIDAPRVATDATRAAIEAATDDDATLLADDQRARFCASIDGRRHVVLGEDIELADRPPASAFLRPGDRGGDHDGDGSGDGAQP